MPRVKRGQIHIKKREKLLKSVKGFKWGRKSKIKLAKVAALKAGVYAYRDRRRKKRDMRSQWQVVINAAIREHGINYSKFIAGLKSKQIEIDRKILSELAKKYPAIFNKIAEDVVTTIKATVKATAKA